MQKSTLKGVHALLLTLLFMGSCSKNTIYRPENTDDDGLPINIPSKVQLRSSIGSDPEKYLGYGFNLSQNLPSDELGFSDTPILDLDRVRNNSPWNPWAEKLGEDVLPPDIVSKDIAMDVRYHNLIDITSAFNSQKISIGGKGSFNGNASISIAYSNLVAWSDSTYVHNLNAYKINKEVIMDGSVADFKHYLSEGFVRDLKTKTVQELISKYGTHLVCKYYLGAFSNFTVLSNSKIFTKDESINIALAFTGVKMNTALTEKVRSNAQSLNVIYSQGGSDYNPSNSALGLSLTNGSTPTIDVSEWSKKLRKNDQSFYKIETDGATIPIPDLIDDIFLKIKYASGIFHQLQGSETVLYVLMDANTLKPVQFNGDYLFFTLKDYSNVTQSKLYYSTALKRVSAKALTGDKDDSGYWSLSLQDNGKWIIRQTYGDKYLTTSLSLSPDLNATTEWALNPILPSGTVNGSVFDWKRSYLPLK